MLVKGRFSYFIPNYYVFTYNYDQSTWSIQFIFNLYKKNYNYVLYNLVEL